VNEAVASALPWVAGAIGLFTFLAIASWSDARRKEREAYYRSEAIKKLAEMQGNVPDSVLQLIREALGGETSEANQRLDKMLMMFYPGVYRRERELYRRSEMLKKLSTMPGATTESALQYIRDEDRRAQQRVNDGLRLGGMIGVASGIGLLIFVRAVMPDMPVYLIGLIPIFVGLALIAFAQIVRGNRG
jgi:hypothetical protein